MIDVIRRVSLPREGVFDWRADRDESTMAGAELLHGRVGAGHALAAFAILYRNMANSGGPWDRN
jgi:hypothetical protein